MLQRVLGRRMVTDRQKRRSIKKETQRGRGERPKQSYGARRPADHPLLQSSFMGEDEDEEGEEN
eukprot:1771356-Pyramimonas_sp.AAC.1